MKTLRLFILGAALLIPSQRGLAQSATTEALQKKYSDALSLFFYNNTLRMLNQSEDKEFDELIKDIEKMRFMLIRKTQSSFNGEDYKALISKYKKEQFEEIMTSRHAGKNFDVYLRETEGKTRGMLVLVNDDDNLYVLDILGRIALNKITSFYDKLDESSDLGSKIRSFISRDGNQENSSQ